MRDRSDPRSGKRQLNGNLTLTIEGAALYRRTVAELETALNDPLIRDEAAEALRSLIAKIVLEPDAAAPDGLRATLHGELATLLTLSELNFAPRFGQQKPSRAFAGEGANAILF